MEKDWTYNPTKYRWLKWPIGDHVKQRSLERQPLRNTTGENCIRIARVRLTETWKIDRYVSIIRLLLLNLYDHLEGSQWFVLVKDWEIPLMLLIVYNFFQAINSNAINKNKNYGSFWNIALKTCNDKNFTLKLKTKAKKSKRIIEINFCFLKIWNSHVRISQKDTKILERFWLMRPWNWLLFWTEKYITQYEFRFRF